MPTTETMPLSSNATSIAASTRGTTRRWIGETPSTSIASISSRMVRDPMSAQIAEPPAPATSSAVTSGLRLLDDRQHARGTGERLRAELLGQRTQSAAR